MHPHMQGSSRSVSGVQASPRLLDRIRAALESKDLKAYVDLFADDAVLEELSNLNPPAHPHVVQGREAILKRFEEEILRDPVSGWARLLKSATIIDEVEDDSGLAFTEVRTYEAGDKVVAQHLAHKQGGRIQHDRMVVAWDQTT
jgi:hypothetical protein